MAWLIGCRPDCCVQPRREVLILLLYAILENFVIASSHLLETSRIVGRVAGKTAGEFARSGSPGRHRRMAEPTGRGFSCR